MLIFVSGLGKNDENGIEMSYFVYMSSCMEVHQMDEALDTGWDEG